MTIKTNDRIEAVVAAARRKPDEIVASRTRLGSNGKWYTVFGVPLGVTLTDEVRIEGYVYRGKDGCTYGQRYPTPEAAAEAHKQRQDKNDQDFRDALLEMTEDELRAQERYWKTREWPKMVATAE